MNGIESHMTDISHVIQLAVAPVFLLTAVATLISSLNVRLGRIVDRRRTLDDSMRDCDDKSRAAAGRELFMLSRRARLVYFAIFAAVLGALLVCCVVASAFVGALITVDLSRLVAVLFVMAMLAIIASLSMFLREVYLAVASGGHSLKLEGKSFI